jgi:TolB-like protein/cytochrome c-type biogenesis protein CcmH/NrfG
MRPPEVATLVAGVLLAFRPLAAQCPDGSALPCRSTLQSPPSPNSIAVLYFDNVSRDSADEYLAEGLTEAVISQLGQVRRISIASRFAVRRYRGRELPQPSAIGRTLGVAYLVTGSVQRVGHQLRVTTELARTATGVRVWGDQFVRSDDSLFALQDDIAQRVADGVAGRLLPAERRAAAAVRVTHNPEAYEHFLRGNQYLAQRTSTGMLRATAEYRRAAALDSGFVSALARVGLAYALRLDWAWDSAGASPADSLLQQGMAAADGALKRDSLNSDAWLARGYLLQFRNPRTWQGVMAAFERATARDPGNAEAWQQWADAARLMGDDSTAVIGYHRALAVDPARPVSLFSYAMTEATPAEAGPLLDSAVALDPGFLPGQYLRALVRFGQGDTAGARREQGTFRCEVCPADMRPVSLAWIAEGLRVTGDTAARTVVEQVVSWLRPAGALSWRVTVPLTAFFASRNDSAQALNLLERIEPRGVVLWSFLTHAEYYPLASNLRFRRILADATPPWAPPELAILDLPIPETARARWTGSYGGPLGHQEITERRNRLIVRNQYGELGRLLYQGGDTFAASWDHELRMVFITGDERAPGFVITRRKRVFPYRRN